MNVSKEGKIIRLDIEHLFTAYLCTFSVSCGFHFIMTNDMHGNSLLNPQYFILLINYFRVSLPGYQGNLQAAISHTSAVSSCERFGVEMILTFVVVFTYFVSTNSHRKLFGNSAAMIGAAYSACNFVSVSFLVFLCLHLKFDLNCTNVYEK